MIRRLVESASSGRSISVAVLFASSAFGLTLFAQAPARNPSLAAGAFTAAQADRGLATFERSCSKCHQSDLRGDAVSEAPALVDEMFTTSFGGQPVRELFEKIRTKMPADKPGTLTPAAALDVVAYLLRANSFPAGSEELTSSDESLARVISKSAPAR